MTGRSPPQPRASLAPPRPATPGASDVTATDRVYQGIQSAVLERRVQPGAWLREAELAAAFGVSRTVVRQALQRLAQDLVVDLVHNRGARVQLPTPEAAGHVFEARRVVECEIARRLGGRLTPTQLQDLNTINNAESAADAACDTVASVRLSGEFHRALALMHGNPVFLKLLDGLLPSTSMLMTQFKVDGGPVCVAHRHSELIAALGQSPAAAGAEMRRHLAELQGALTPVQAAPRLRDLFRAYRDDPPAPAAGPPAPHQWRTAAATAVPQARIRKRLSSRP